MSRRLTDAEKRRIEKEIRNDYELKVEQKKEALLRAREMRSRITDPAPNHTLTSIQSHASAGDPRKSSQPTSAPTGPAIAPPMTLDNAPPASGTATTSNGPSQSLNPAHKRPSPSIYSGLQPVRKTSQAKVAKHHESSRPGASSDRAPSEDANVASSPDLQQPEWYSKLRPSNTRSQGDKTQVSLACERLRHAIGRYIETMDPKFLDIIRTTLHAVAFSTVTRTLVRDQRMLHNTNGLPNLFEPRYSNDVTFPFDIAADAKELYHKWCSQVFDVELLRGIIPGKGSKSRLDKDGGFETERTGDRINKDWPGYTSANYHGNGKLLNGQWWPLQICAVRDGAHGQTMRGIHGREGEGAYSIVMAGGTHHGEKYTDEDHGDMIWYCGTDGKDGDIAGDTARLIESFESKKPVRLLRSHNARTQYSPEIGFRYDGLYQVVEVSKVAEAPPDKQRHRFRMVRQTAEPLRGGQGPEARPTAEEKKAWQDVQIGRKS